MNDKLDFEIGTSPILYSDDKGALCEDSDYKVIYRNDNSHALSVMSGGYNPLTVKDFKDITGRLQRASGFEMTGYSTFKGGRVILSQLKNNSDTIRIADNEIKDYLVLGSSFDGTQPIFVGTSTFLVRCSNAFSRISKHNKIRHTKSADIKLEDLVKSIEMYFEQRYELYEKFNKWTGVSVHSDQVVKLIKDITSLDDVVENNSTQKLNKAEAIKKNIQIETNALGDNLWGVFNGISRYSTHEMSKKSEVFGSIVGSRAVFNNNAFKLIEELENA